jgi:hypothetical protein
MEDLLANLQRCNRAISDASRGRVDVSCAQVLPKDLGDWRPTIRRVTDSNHVTRKSADGSSAGSRAGRAANANAVSAGT